MALPYQQHHQKLKQQQQKEISSSNFDYKILHKPFWIWNKKEHLVQAKETNEECCWNHVVGLPRKDGKKEYPLFDYERTLFYSLIDQEVNNPLNHSFKDKHLWVNKATGLGVTEFFLRLMGWLCTSTENYGNSQMCIITGPNLDQAVKLQTS
jgi:hypothetical protein